MSNEWLAICGTALWMWANHSTTFRALARFKEMTT
jgi:hypothetical protein